MKSERNYTIEFFRIMFAVNFVAIHVFMVFPGSYLGQPPTFAFALDVIIPFMAFSGYFLMQDFKRQQSRSLASHLSAGRQAWTYLKARILGLLPAFLVAQLSGFVALYIHKGIPLSLWPSAFLSHIGEFFGLQITGIGMGNASVGLWGEAARTLQLLNSPMWFISGIFICGYLVYFLLAKNEAKFIGFIAPLFGILFYASQYMLDSNPNWFNWRHLGDFVFAEAFPHMFVGLSIGCIIWVAVDHLKNKKWSKGMLVFLTVVQAILGVFVILKTWVPVNVPFMRYINVNWGSVHLLTIIFSFLILLNVDGFTRFPLFRSKIWKTPGRLALYIYMFHWPVIVFCSMILNVKDSSQLYLLYGVATVVSIAVGYLFMKLDTKIFQPWLKSKPWYSKEQKELEKSLEAAVK